MNRDVAYTGSARQMTLDQHAGLAPVGREQAGLEQAGLKQAGVGQAGLGQAGWEQAVAVSGQGALLLLQLQGELGGDWDACILAGQVPLAWCCAVPVQPGARLRRCFPLLEDQWPQAFYRVLGTRRSVSFECRDLHLGSWLQVQLSPVDADAGVVGLMITDVSKRRRREIDGEERKRHYRAVIDAMPMPVWVLDADGQVAFVNRPFDAFFGIRGNVGELDWSGLLHPHDCADFLVRLQYALEIPGDFAAVVRGRRADGQWRWLEAQATPRFSPRGKFTGLSGSLRDITEHRELAQARDHLLAGERAARTAAEATTRLKDEFLATLSHELRTPLTAVLGWTELLLQRMGPDDPGHRGLTVISSSAQSLRRLISDMLDLSGMLVGKLYLDMADIDLCEQLRESAMALDASAAPGAAPIHLHLPATPLHVHGDSTRLRQVFWNLLSNARKFTSHLSAGQIDVRLEPDGGQCHVRVCDNGAGIEPEFLPHLFNRFSQADASTTRRHGGLGLGLAIVEQLVSLHGGSVRVESKGAGRGSCFIVTLPLRDCSARALAPATAGPEERGLAAGTDSALLAGCRLLLVDDQPDILDYLRLALERHGARVSHANSGHDALQLLSGVRPGYFHVLLSDIGMPGMDGYALARVVRQDMGLGPQQLPMIAVTALAREDDRRDALDSGFQAVVTKPCNLSQLVAEIARHWRHAQGAVVASG